MRRVLTVLLLLILPLQLSWAVAAAYCQHEVTPQVATHPGHHAHQHALDADPATSDVAPDHAHAQDDTNDKSPCVDDDCAYCHLACLKTVTVPALAVMASAGSSFIAHGAPAIVSQTSGGIDRPNWRAA